MFENLINDAKSSAGSFVAKYLARASVMVPFAIALGFATASIALILIARFGSVVGCLIVAGAYTAIGLVSALAVSRKEREAAIAPRPANSQAETSAAAASTTEAPIDMAALVALVIPFLLTQLKSAPAENGANVIVRNIPLVTLAALLALLLWPVEPETHTGESEAGSNGLNDMSPPDDDTVLHYGGAEKSNDPAPS